MHIVGTPEHKDGGIAWILPPRTGTRYIRALIKKHGWLIGNCGHHHIMPERLEDHHQLLCNVRNPYTRVQSWWKHINQAPKTKTPILFEDYLLALSGIVADGSASNHVESIMFVKHNPAISYPQSVTGLLNHGKIDIGRVDKFIRMESFEEDLISVGFPSDVPNIYVSNNPTSMQLDWFYDKPEFATIVSDMYADDFENFGYTIL